MPEPREFGTDGDTARSEWNEAAADVAERTGEAVAEAKRGARRVADEASRTMRDAKERVTAVYGRTAETAERAYRDARGYAQQNPGTAAAVTFAAGVGVGMMLAARGGHSSYRRGLVPVVALALANAVVDVFDKDR